MANPDIGAAIKSAREKLKINIKAGAFGARMGHTLRIWDLRRAAYSHAIRDLDWEDEFGRALSIQLEEDALKEMVGWAREGDRDAHLIVCEVLAELVREYRHPPLFLREYLLELLNAEADYKQPAQRGWDPVGRYGRDQCIRIAVSELVCVHGINRTRNPATENPSACSIVAEVLDELGVKISEKTIAEITKGIGRPDED